MLLITGFLSVEIEVYAVCGTVSGERKWLQWLVRLAQGCSPTHILIVNQLTSLIGITRSDKDKCICLTGGEPFSPQE